MVTWLAVLNPAWMFAVLTILPSTPVYPRTKAEVGSPRRRPEESNENFVVSIPVFCIVSCRRESLRIGALVGCRKQGPVERYPWEQSVCYVICIPWGYVELKLLFCFVLSRRRSAGLVRKGRMLRGWFSSNLCLLTLPPTARCLYPLPFLSLSCKLYMRLSSHSRPSHGRQYNCLARTTPSPWVTHFPPP